MAGEQQFTPEAAKQALGIVHSPDTAISGTPNPVLEASQKRYAAGQVEESLKVLSGDVLPHTEEDDKRVLIWNLSSVRDASTQEKKEPTSGNEKTRFDESKEKINRERKFLEEGTADADFIKQIRLSLEKSGPYADLLKSMSNDADKDTYVQELMETPGYREKLRQLRITRLPLDKKLSNESAVQNLELEIAKLSAQLGAEVTQTDIDNARTELDNAKAGLTPRAADLLQLQIKTKNLEELESEMPDIKKQLRDNKGTGKPFADELDSLNRERSTLNVTTDAVRIKEIDTRVKEIEKNPKYLNYSSAKAEIQEHIDLINDIARLQVDLAPLQQEVQKKDEALKVLIEKQKTNITPQQKAEIEADIQSKKGLLADAKTALEAEMIKFYRDVTHMGEDAMEQYLNGALGKIKDIWNEEATKQAAEDTTKEGKLAALAIEKAYEHLCKTKSTRKDGVTVYIPDKNKSKNILNEAFKAGGGENIAIYLETKTFAELGITAEEHTALKEKLKDPDFRKAQSEGIAKQALADYLIAGGRLNQDIVNSLATTDFGKTLITEARAKVDAAKQLYKDQLGNGVLDKSTRFGEYFKGNWWKWGIGIIALLIILGIISAGR